MNNSVPSCVQDSHSTSSNEETFLQDFVENLEEMFPQYYMNSDMFEPSTTS